MTEVDARHELPVAVIGAGPTGLAAAAHLLTRGLRPLVLEAGDQVGAGVAAWGHVQLFSPWAMNIDDTARALLERVGWSVPAEDEYPTGAELVEHYLQPLADTPQLAAHVRLSRRVLAVSRLGLDKLRTDGREQTPFELISAGPNGVERHLAQAVLDASGTIGTPNPLGAGGVPAAGEAELADRIAYGHPDILGRDRALYAGQRVLVAGSGHSALGALLDLMRLREEHPETQILWAVRRDSISDYFGGADTDQLPQRGRVALKVAERFHELNAYAGFAAHDLAVHADGVVASNGSHRLPPVDRVIAATGYRPDLSLLRELRVELDPWVESPPQLAPLIDPNLHSCGTVRAHGVDQLSHPEPGVYVVGMKSYGRAPTFLMKTGYEQVRSIAAALAGDFEAARRVALVLPETGVCSGPGSDDGAGGRGAADLQPVATSGGGCC